MVKIIITDIDGVLTSGKIYLDENSQISKSYCLKDLDAVSSLRERGYSFGIITGEDNYYTEFIKKVMQPDYFYSGCKEKLTAIHEILSQTGFQPEEICYIGDGLYDLDAIKFAGLGICPADAICEVRAAAIHILESNGGEGCLWETLSFLKRRMETPACETKAVSIQNIMEEHELLVNSMLKEYELLDNIAAAVALFQQVFLNSGQVLLCGNGGSAGDAQHIAAELVGRFYLERPAFNAEALNCNTSSLTAVSNDYGYEHVFSRQVEAKGRAEDVLIGITTSGSSKSIMEALKKAGEKGMHTVLLTGNKHSELEAYAELIIRVPSCVTPRIQEMHILIGHIICENVEKLLCIK